MISAFKADKVFRKHRSIPAPNIESRSKLATNIAMPSATSDPEFKTIQITKLHPTLDFGAEVSGIDLSQPIPDDVFQEILGAMAKVTMLMSGRSVTSAMLTDVL